MRPIFPHTTVDWKTKTLQGHTTYFHKCFHAVCCTDLPLSLLLTFLPTYPETLDLSLSLINKKEQRHFNDQLYFWKKPTAMHSQLACGASCSVKRQYHMETCHDVSLCYLSTMKCAQKCHMTAISLQIQLRRQPWISGDNLRAPDMKMQVLST